MRINPYAPIFSSTPARITLTSVGASVCASGSQVWKGNMGILMAKARKINRKISSCQLQPKIGLAPARNCMCVEKNCMLAVFPPARKYSSRIPASIKILPKKV